MAGKYNKNPISLREGKVFIDGVEVMDSVKCEIIFTPDTWTGRVLGEKTPSTRWIGGAYKGTITRRRSTPFLKDAATKYMRTGITPEFTIQGIMDDANSDYFEDYGAIAITAVGCVLTGDFSLISMDSGGNIADDSLSFNAKDIV
jgi:hypothetical protein